MMGLYLKMPRFIQNMGITLKGLKNKRDRFGKTYQRHLKFLSEFEKLSYEEKQLYQKNELINLIEYSRNNSEFYSERLKKVDTRHGEINSILQQIDKLSKDDLRLNLNAIYTSKDVVSYSGGTTGVPLKVYYTLDDFQKRMATLDYFKYRTSGFQNNRMWRASFTGKEIISRNVQTIKKPYRINLFARQYLFSSFHINKSNIDSYIKALNNVKPAIIDGFYSSILDIAIYLNVNDIKLDFYPLAIYPTSETLTDEGVKEIEQAFGCSVFNQYASSEGAPFIVECDHNNLHILSSTGIFEIEKNGNIVVTSFTTRGTPLVRYDIGDSVEGFKKNQKCKCGITGDTVEKILGRSTNYIFDGNGNKLTEANVANFFKELDELILKGQIIEKKGKEYEINIVLHSEENFDNNRMIKSCKRFLKSENVKLSLVSKIPVEKSGKFMILKRVTE